MILRVLSWLCVAYWIIILVAMATIDYVVPTSGVVCTILVTILALIDSAIMGGD
ncbi:hypothetical protein [Paenibacillus terrae]|uniref:hypothetical protein n=1 Tax=Paenibacillus terrae TaxID=159743 RepID=UPI0016568728|nr:hypothetical protein [Paenibacillus terrae]